MSEIYDFTIAYGIAKRYVTLLFKNYYSNVTIVGLENLPLDTPAILAPNHTNALMDALAVLSAVPHRLSVVFLARSDIFNNSTVASLLRFTKILPAFRIRDGINTLGKNAAVFDVCVEALHLNHAVCLMPEGNQEIEPWIRPLAKGIFRIAFAAQQKFENNKAVKIIPIGLDYGSIVKANKHLIIQFGKPIEVADYMEIYKKNPAIATNELRKCLFDDLCSLTLNLPSEKHYKCFKDVATICSSIELKKFNGRDNDLKRHFARQLIGKKLVAYERSKPQVISILSDKNDRYQNLLGLLKTKDWVLANTVSEIYILIIRCIGLFLSFPFFFYGLLINVLPFYSPTLVRKYLLKAQYQGFFSSLEFGVGVLSFPVFYLLQFAILLVFTNLSWWICCLMLISFFPFGRFALKWSAWAKKTKAEIKFLLLKNKKDDLLIEAIALRKEIICAYEEMSNGL